MDEKTLAQSELRALAYSLEEALIADAVDSFVESLRLSFSSEKLQVNMTDFEHGIPLAILSALANKLPEVFGTASLQKLVADQAEMNEMGRRAFERAQAQVAAERRDA